MSLPKVLEEILSKRYYLQNTFVVEQNEEDQDDVFDEDELIEIGTIAASFIPGIGDIASLYDAFDSFTKGEYGESALALASAIPVIGVGADVARAGIKAEKLVSKIGSKGMRSIEKLENLNATNKKLKNSIEIETIAKQDPRYPKISIKSQKGEKYIEPKYGVEAKPLKAPTTKVPEKPLEILPQPEPVSIPKINPFKWTRELFPEFQPFTPPEMPTPEAKAELETKPQLDPLLQTMTVASTVPYTTKMEYPVTQPEPQREKVKQQKKLQTDEEDKDETRRRRLPDMVIQTGVDPQSLQNILGTAAPAETGLQKKLFLGRFGGTYQIK
jgi:hypothetical protein